MESGVASGVGKQRYPDVPVYGFHDWSKPAELGGLEGTGARMFSDASGGRVMDGLRGRGDGPMQMQAVRESGMGATQLRSFLGDWSTILSGAEGTVHG